MVSKTPLWALIPIAALLPAAASAQIAMVSATTCGTGVFPATTCTIPATGSGHLIVVAWSSSWGAQPTVSSIADNAGNSYTEAGSALSALTSEDMVDIWYAKNSTAGATTLTITPNPAATSGGAVIWEFSGVDTTAPLDQTSVLSNQAATATPSGASVTTTSASEVIISTLVPSGSLTGLASGGFTSDATFFGTGWAHMITSSAGTYAPQWNTSSGTFASSTVSFKASSGSSGTSGTPANACDLVAPFGTVDQSDVQAAVNMTLTPSACTSSVNIAGAGVCNAIIVQRVINASMGQTCLVSTGLHVVSLTWAASTSSGITGYQVSRGTSSSGPFTPLTTVSASTLSYVDTTVASGTTYYYVVATVAGTSTSANSSPVTATVPTP